MAPVQIAYPVVHFRSGRRARVRLLSLHTTEGAREVESLGAFLRRKGTASYHAATDDAKIAFYVNRLNEAWHLRNGNPIADGFCFCGFASWSRDEWFRHPIMLENAAWWLASCARERGIPLRWLSVAETRDAVRDARHPGGVCDHDDYSDATGDGTHWDCGEGLPKDWLINRAREIQAGHQENDMQLSDRYRDWAGNEQTVQEAYNNIDKRTVHVVTRIDETANAIIGFEERQAARDADLVKRLERIEAAVAGILESHTPRP